MDTLRVRVRSLFVKRLMDVAGASAGLVVAAPAILGIAALIRLRLGAPVLFRQERPGLGERPFVILKFRTMRDAVDVDGRSLPDKERLTALGRFLRATSLDELPELWNVLRGEMSLVGPRPLLMEYLAEYDEVQRRRHDMKPGMTGWTAVSGRNSLDWDEKFALDVWYVENWSNELDLKIIFQTIVAVLKREGIDHPSGVPMPKFTRKAANGNGATP